MDTLPEGLVTALADSYAIERELGQGGMATVYLAQDLKHHRLVALKVLHAQRAPELAAVRFRREIQLVARLHHPNILPVFDSGEAAGHLWFTMPYVEGGSLRDRMKQEGRLPVDEALRLAIQVSRAIDYAHRQGVIHRDIKPANILLTRDGDPLVADFGVARALNPRPSRDMRVTAGPIGTPAYMAPEQASGQEAVDARADQFGLAITLYEMLSGQLPFSAYSLADLVDEQLGGPPGVRLYREEVPESVALALTRAMAVKPEQRFESMAAFGRALGDTTAPGSQAPRASRRVPAWLALVLVLAAVGGGFFLRRTPPAPQPTDGRPVIAVLPFDYQGDSTDAYLADGVADEVRSKLTRIGGVAVIARASSIEYRHGSKRPEQIARELGADYLLTGTVQWQKESGGSRGRVRVRPELLQVGGGRAPSTRWGEQFDVAVTDVFDMQTDIAERVAGRLDLALADSVSRRIAVPPTTNLQAYDSYLRGLHLDEEQYAADPATVRRAIRHFEQAVALDSTFALAWARLAASRVWLYGNTVPTREIMEQARTAAERAVRLDPASAPARAALGFFYGLVAHDNLRARTEYQTALVIDPEDAVTLRRLATVEQSLGQWDSALVHAQRASRLDPRSIGAAIRLAWILRVLRRTGEARAVMDRTLGQAPTNLVAVEERALDDVAEGNLAGARATLRSVPSETEPAALVAYLASYQDLFWVLDDEQRRLLLTLSPAEFDGDEGVWALVRAETYWMTGDSARMRSFGDTAAREFARQRAGAPADPQRMILAGLALAYSGRGSAGVALAEQGVALMPIERDHINGTYFRHLLARVYVVAGRQEKAIDVLEQLLKLPYDLTPGWLRIDPNFAPLRGWERFERLIRAGRDPAQPQ